MTNVLLITYLMSLIYLSIANRIMSYVGILAFQGLLLFVSSFIELDEMNSINLTFVLLETIVFKTIAVPLFLRYTIKQNNFTRESEPYLPHFFSLIIVTSIIVITFLLSNMMDDIKLNKVYFVTALSSLFVGLYIISSRKKIITHVMGFLIIENGVFILSLAVGNEMPMLVNSGILLDLFISVLLLGIFLNKIGDVLKDVDVNQLSNLKD